MTDTTRPPRHPPLLAAALGLGLTLGPAAANAAPGVSVGGQVGTQGAQGSANRTGANKPKKKGYKLPERIAQGNAISLLLPVQVGFAGYLPRVRLGFQYDRQIVKSHWVYLGAAALLDRGDWKTFKLDKCGLGSSTMSCNKGTVAGFDVYAGYAHKWYLKEYPWLVPIARGAVGGGWWKLPSIGSSRQQSRDSTWSLSLRGGGGLRFFPILDLGVGVDVNFVLGFEVSKDKNLGVATTEKKTNFLFGMEILPLVVEYRF